MKLKQIARTAGPYHPARPRLIAALLKWCTGCKCWQRRDEFGPHAGRRDMLQPGDLDGEPMAG